MRENHKDVSGLIALQVALAQRKKFLYILKNTDFLNYAQILKVYGLTDLKSEKGEGLQ
jgi:ribosomal protein S15P/S13E